MREHFHALHVFQVSISLFYFSSSRLPLSIQIAADLDAIWQSRFHYCINGDEILVRVAEAAVLTFRCRPGPSTCQGLWLMSLIFRTQSARVALMSRERVWCPRGLYAVSTPCGGHLGLPRDEGKRRGLARGSPGYELMRTAWITERVAVQTSLGYRSATVESLS